MIQDGDSLAPPSALKLLAQKLSLGLTSALLIVSVGLPVIASPSAIGTRPVALTVLSEEQIENRVERDISSLGSLSVGLPHNGRLLNGVQPESSKLFEVVAEDFCWGTQETVDALRTAVRAVHRVHPNTDPLHIGHISKKSGGYLSPHLSHQSGRDADIGYFYKSKRAWYRRATWQTLDTARTWTLVKAMITQTDVEFIFIDYSIQKVLRQHALSQGEDSRWIAEVFAGSAHRPAIIRHAPGHATHIHVRFYNPVAQRNAQIAYPFLLKQELIEPVVVYAHHKVRPGETLGRIAKRYGTTVQAIQNANGLRSTLIQARKTYKIPRRGGPSPVKDELEFPPRLLPPTG